MLSLMSESDDGLQYWVNRDEDYQVRVKSHKTKIGTIQVLRIDRGSKKGNFSFDKLQEIKNYIAGSSAQAIEIFPHKLDHETLENERVLWVLPKGKELPLNPNDVFDLNEIT